MTDDEWRSRFPRRLVHLDFHTGPAIPDVGVEFDADQFARTFRDAHVESVTVFAKCHHGHLYYRTARPERHPGLSDDVDLLGQQIEALHAAGIRAPIYLSVQCDEYAADQRQDWVALTPDLQQVRRPPVVPGVAGGLTAAWQVLDMSSPYQEYLAEQIEEVLDIYGPVDGMFLDMCWDQPSSSRWAIDGMRRLGLDPLDANNRTQYGRHVAHRYMERFTKMIEPALVKGSPTGVWFNSRERSRLTHERSLLRHIEVEALPTGSWGYDYLPYVGRLVHYFGLPVLSQTGRFHRSWGDMASLKSPASLKYDLGRIIMYGHSCSIGDLLPPSGKPSDAVYRLIAPAYQYIEACEPFVEGTVPAVDIALITDLDLGDRPGPGVTGAIKVLQRLRQQFVVVPQGADIDHYGVVVVPEGLSIGETLAAGLLRRVATGKAVVLAVASVPEDPIGDALLEGLGVRRIGHAPFTTVFLGTTGGDLVDPPIGLDIRVHGQGVLLEPLSGTEVIVDLVYPYFERTFEHFSGHSYTPPGRRSGYGAIFQRREVILLAVPLFAGAAEEGNPEYERILERCFNRLLPTPVLRASGPQHLETAVMQRSGSTVVHLLSFVPSRLGSGLDLVFDPFPLVDVDVEVRMAEAPVRVSVQPRDESMVWRYEEGYVKTKITCLDGHAMVVLDT